MHVIFFLLKSYFNTTTLFHGNPNFRFVEILLNKTRDQRLLNLICLKFLCVSFDQLACLHEWSRIATHWYAPHALDEYAQDCCILVRTGDPHGMRASCRARFLSGHDRFPILMLNIYFRFVAEWITKRTNASGCQQPFPD